MTHQNPPLYVRIIPAKGQGGEVPVVLIHGFASDGSTDWLDTGVAQALAAAGRESWVPDLRGHGLSPAPGSASEATTAVLVSDLVALIDATGADKVDVAGYSLGARLAWELPAASGGRVRRLILGGISPAEPFGAVDLAALESLLGGEDVAADPLTGTIAQMISSPGRNPKALARCVAGLAAEPFAPNVLDPAPVTLFMAGEDDFLARGIDALVRKVPGARFIPVPGDHLGALASTELRDAAVEFLS